MTKCIEIKTGDWVLSFDQPYGLHDEKTMPEILESYAFQHWMDTRGKEEIFFVLQVQKVMPKTFTATGVHRYIEDGDRLPRSNVIAAVKSEASALALRDKLYAIGVETGDKIEVEMFRRVEKFAAREKAKALKKIHRCFPYFFGSGA